MEPATLHVPSPSHPTLASALAACASSPDATVVLAAGVYRVDATLRLGHGASLVGAGPSTVVESVAHTTLVCDGAARVADLALRQLGDGDQAASMVGSNLYMAPEVFAPKKYRVVGYTAKVDIWSIGVVIFEMLAGVTPFTGSSQMELFSNIQKGFLSRGAIIGDGCLIHVAYVI